MSTFMDPNNISMSGGKFNKGGGTDKLSGLLELMLPQLLLGLGSSMAPEESPLRNMGHLSEMIAKSMQDKLYNQYLEKRKVDPNATAPIGLSSELRNMADQTALAIQQQQFTKDIANRQLALEKSTQEGLASYRRDSLAQDKILTERKIGSDETLAKEDRTLRGDLTREQLRQQAAIAGDAHALEREKAVAYDTLHRNLASNEDTLRRDLSREEQTSRERVAKEMHGNELTPNQRAGLTILGMDDPLYHDLAFSLLGIKPSFYSINTQKTSDAGQKTATFKSCMGADRKKPADHLMSYTPDQFRSILHSLRKAQ